MYMSVCARARTCVYVRIMCIGYIDVNIFMAKRIHTHTRVDSVYNGLTKVAIIDR